ncbi:hypothetical protein [Corynebacterium sp.]|uniref:hypothetical protein n=1 Tax=Corynebacterium sp. TaxID=1720 RepID=UPI0025C66FD6|nr:hypothetical protein [Corynebacterium sp.]
MRDLCIAVDGERAVEGLLDDSGAGGEDDTGTGGATPTPAATDLVTDAEDAVANVVTTMTRGVLPEDLRTTLRVLTAVSGNLSPAPQ